MLNDVNTSGKGLFLFFAIVGLFLLMAVTTLLWWLVSPQLHIISELLAIVLLYTLRLFYLVILIGIVLVLLTCYTGRNFLVIRFAVRLSMMILYPVALLLGRLFLSRDRLQESFVHVNNSFIKSMKGRFIPARVLILLPHCLQQTACGIRITLDIGRCQSCGRCDIGELKELARRYGVPIAIATGGTLARRIVVKNRPKFIIAVACHRDLVSGIQDVFPIPVYGVLNDRPEGPCVNTRVAVERIEHALQAVVKT
ncbi:MAG: DUF116 domain-containing protein [Candidatus Cloacimonetes bacterium]|nr:DUF116 domain-containing protein [Candidatus Cloacimonadota bacterium]